VPSARQKFVVRPVAQFTHAPASRPQEPSAEGTQDPAEQQPFWQVVLSHTQAPPTQWSPSAQRSPSAPQLHRPPTQLLARVASHALHAPPSMPQAAVEGEVQVAPAQQPAPHVALLQPWHAWLWQL
jgi:hypothetical protein